MEGNQSNNKHNNDNASTASSNQAAPTTGLPPTRHSIDQLREDKKQQQRGIALFLLLCIWLWITYGFNWIIQHSSFVTLVYLVIITLFGAFPVHTRIAPLTRENFN